MRLTLGSSGLYPMPMYALATRPERMSSGTTRFAMSTGTANPIPTFPPDSLKIAVFMPIISPREFNSGPPELPGLIAASVWMTPAICSPEGDCSGRSSALMMPVVSVWSRPNGLPIASTFCPTWRPDEVPIGTARSFSGGASIRSTAMSWSGSTPTTRAL